MTSTEGGLPDAGAPITSGGCARAPRPARVRRTLKRAPPAAQSRLPPWTMHDVARAGHVVMDGRVYDVSSIAPSHPGGEAVVRRFAGRDMSDAFRRARHSAHAREWLERHCVGVLR